MAAEGFLAVIQGTLDLLILKALSLGPVHAWGIGARIAELSGGAFSLGQGSLYPAVHRFESRGWVASYWRTTDNNRIARYYELTTAGRHALHVETERWRRYAAVMDRVIEAD
ncbi:MAG TPA: PadR family transcriptional regulator [Gemmatimonadaceae bacterium]|jgi:transcriptional regulator|nr:PadR family transcriptional regulator [Gemmatimonadaceae bacterium]